MPADRVRAAASREYGSLRVATAGDPMALDGHDGTHNSYNQS